MIRTKQPTKKMSPDDRQLLYRFNVMNELVGRMQLAAILGQQYGGSRNLYEALGYKNELTFDDYLAQYDRQDIARAIIDRPVDATWRGDFGVLEAGDTHDTKFENAWDELAERLNLKSQFVALDKLVGVGNYAVLYMGYDDVQDPDQASQAVTTGRKLLFVQPLSQKNAAIQEWDNDPKSPRYNTPTIYQITTDSAGTKKTTTYRVHFSRVLHIADGCLESKVNGQPRLKAVFNRLQDIEKIVGGSGEMYWRGARPGYQGKVDENFTVTPEMRADLKEQVEAFEHNLKRLFINEGVTLESLQQQVADPKGHIDVQIQMISAATGIPKRILTGSELGELASSEDKSNWLDYVEGRRLEYAEPKIVKPFIKANIEVGVLPAPTSSDYSVQWEDLRAQSDKEKADVGKTRAEAIGAYAANPASMDVLSIEAFLKFGLGLDEEDIELIQEQQDAAIAEEEEDAARAAKAAAAAPTPPVPSPTGDGRQPPPTPAPGDGGATA